MSLCVDKFLISWGCLHTPATWGLLSGSYLATDGQRTTKSQMCCGNELQYVVYFFINTVIYCFLY